MKRAGPRHRGMMDIGPYFAADAGGRRTQQFGIGQLPAGLPPLELPAGLGDAFSLLTQGAKSLGMMTPWAEQIGDFEWNPIPQPPEFNVAAYEYGFIEPKLRAMGMGPAGFVAFGSGKPIAISMVEAMFTGTPYKLFSGQAVYQQLDPAAVPEIGFLYWGQLRDVGDQLGGDGDLQLAADSVAGQGSGLVLWAVEMPYSTTALRPVPATDFMSAYQAQYGTGAPQPDRINGKAPPGGGDAITTTKSTTTPATTPPAEKKSSMGTTLLLGLGAAALTYVVVRELRGSR